MKNTILFLSLVLAAPSLAHAAKADRLFAQMRIHANTPQGWRAHEQLENMNDSVLEPLRDAVTRLGTPIGFRSPEDFIWYRRQVLALVQHYSAALPEKLNRVFGSNSGCAAMGELVQDWQRADSSKPMGEILEVVTGPRNFGLLVQAFKEQQLPKSEDAITMLKTIRAALPHADRDDLLKLAGFLRIYSEIESVRNSEAQVVEIGLIQQHITANFMRTRNRTAGKCTPFISPITAQGAAAVGAEAAR